MFDKFFEQHKPEHEHLPATDSTRRINSVLRDKVNGGDTNSTAGHTEIKPVKTKHIIRAALISAAAAITAAVSLITVNADYKSDEKYIVRVNNIRVEAEISTFESENLNYDVVTFELPCEIFVDEDGGSIDPEAENEFRRYTYYSGTEILDETFEDGTHMIRHFSGARDDELKGHMMPGLPFGISGSSSADSKTSFIEVTYDADFVKRYWENCQMEASDASAP